MRNFNLKSLLALVAFVGALAVPTAVEAYRATISSWATDRQDGTRAEVDAVVYYSGNKSEPEGTLNYGSSSVETFGPIYQSYQDQYATGNLGGINGFSWIDPPCDPINEDFDWTVTIDMTTLHKVDTGTSSAGCGGGGGPL